MVIWIIGKSGVGKTYLASRLVKIYKKKYKKIIWVDGDKFRRKYSKDLGYTIRDRRKNSMRIQKYCKKYDLKQYFVICSILSLFKNHQKSNRKLFSSYFQIFIKANFVEIKKRNNKSIYSKIKNVVGKDILFPTPYKNDMIIKNDFNSEFTKKIKKICKKINEKL